ncbi:HNH/ENDO VII family nuclease [Rosenbergiella epipactidis]|uniref:HNH/ENDO VII family nuclease n=1 Tax=Rosenbergiella epipactidis TaxID=1544694 RepID=UPI0030C8B09A
MAGGDVAKALAGASAPYLAEVIHRQTTSADGEVNKTANLMAHAVVNAALSLAKGENALAGASSAVTAEAVGLISKAYYDKKPSELDESQKQTISALASLAAGLAGGLVGGDTASAVSGMQTGKVTVENNALANVLAAAEANKKGAIENYLKAQKAVCEGNQAACTQMVKDVAGTGLDFVPIVGDIKGFVEAQTAIDYLAAALGVIPGAGDVAGKAIKAAETALKKGDVAEASKLINKASDDVTSVSYFRQERKYWSAEPVNINGNKVYQRNDFFDPNAVDARGRTNIQRMEKGLAPLDINGQSVNLHHMLQKQDDHIAEVTQSFHKDNHIVIHINDNSIPSGINRNEFNKWRSDYWKQRSNDFKK